MYYQSNESGKTVLIGPDDDDMDNSGADLDASHYLGLSANTQQLLVDFHQALNQSNTSPECMKLYEEICYSFLEDIQVYKKDVRRIEKILEKDKENNEKTMRQMIEEAEQQMNSLVEKVKEEQRQEFDKLVQKIKLDHQIELLNLQDNLERVQESENRLKENKMDETAQISQLRAQLEKMKTENSDLQVKLKEAKTEQSLLRSEIADLKLICNDKAFNNKSTSESVREVNKLQNQISALNEVNKMLTDNNDILMNELENIKHSKTTQEKEAAKQIALNSIYYAVNKEKGLSSFEISPTFMQPRNTSSLEHESDMIDDSGCAVSSLNDMYEFDTDSSIYLSQSQTNLATSPNQTSNNLSSPPPSISVMANRNLLEETEEQMEQSSSKKIKLIPSPPAITAVPTSKESNKLSKKSKEVVSNNNINKQPDRMFKIVFAGDSAVGKTSFIMRYCNGVFSATTNTTLGVDFQVKMMDLDNRQIALQLWDTCGQERFRSIAKSYFRRADGVVLMYDCTYEKSFVNVREWMNTVSEASDKRLPVIVIGNKTDMRETAQSQGRTVVTTEQGARLAKEFDALFIETSAKSDSNIEESLVEMCRIMSVNQDVELQADTIKLGDLEQKKKRCC